MATLFEIAANSFARWSRSKFVPNFLFAGLLTLSTTSKLHKRAIVLEMGPRLRFIGVFRYSLDNFEDARRAAPQHSEGSFGPRLEKGVFSTGAELGDKNCDH